MCSGSLFLNSLLGEFEQEHHIRSIKINNIFEIFKNIKLQNLKDKTIKSQDLRDKTIKSQNLRNKTIKSQDLKYSR